MDDNLEKLQSLGAQKIYETTHIPVEHVQALLHNSFESFSKVQFLGFVSILEREYHLDLSKLRESGISYFNDKSSLYADTKVFVASNKKKKKSLLYVVIASAIFLLALLYSFDAFSDGSEIQEHVVDDSMIKSIQQSIDADSNESIYDMNTTDLEDTNETVDVAQVVEEQVVEKAFKVNAKSNVWMGYIDFQSNKKYQKSFTGEMDLDPNKDWLLFFGHGYIDIYVNGELKKFNSRNNVRFLYKNGELETITADEFKILNRGSQW